MGTAMNIMPNGWKGVDMDKEKIMQGVKLLLEGMGEDITREGLIETPDRVARMYEEIFAGLTEDAAVPLSKTFSVEGKNCNTDSLAQNNAISSNYNAVDMIIEKDICFYSMCEHHLLPFYGKAHIAYIPDDRVVGLSKLARTVEVYAKRPQLQERMTVQIADALMQNLNCKGTMVILEAEHMCMTMRGVKKPGSKTITFSAKGVFEEDKLLQDTFIKLSGVN